MGDDLVAVDLGENTVQEVAAGQSHTCVLLTSGNVACFGFNLYGQVRGSRTPMSWWECTAAWPNGKCRALLARSSP